MARGRGSFIRTVALTEAGDHLLAAWSDASGSWVRLLPRQGWEDGGTDGLNSPIRIGAPAESLAATADGAGGYAVALSRPGDVIDGGGELVLALLDSGGWLRSRQRVASSLGAYSRGVALGQTPQGPVVLWHDGVPGLPRIMLASPGERVRQLAPRGRGRLLERNSCCPTLVRRGDGWVALWGEYHVGRHWSAVMAHPLDGEARPSEGPQEIAESRLAESWPAAVECGGDMAFVYRDRRGGDSRDQLFLGRLSASGEVLRRPQRVARFDGRSRASLLTNGHVVASVALRSWSKEWILGFDRFDCAGQRQGAELHVFANQVRFTDVDALRVGTRYLLLYAEDEPEQRVWLAAIHCR